MMDDNTATPLKDDPGNSPPEELTKEKLITKCKNLLTIAQKAKKARDEYVEKNKLLSEDNDKFGTKVQKLEKDLVTAQEMLATFTEQKLKMSMQMDELKKDRKQLNQDLMSSAQVKDELETENISLKRQYTRMIAENEDLINQLGETENRLKNAVALKTDINKLQENNEHIKLYCSNVTQEKLGVEEECRRLSQKIAALENQVKVFQEYISGKFGVNSSDVDSWINAIEVRINSNANTELGRADDNNELKIKLAEETEKCNKINSELKETLSNLSSTVSERNDLQIEVKKIVDVNEQLRKELESLNSDKDKMMNNLENMRIETRQLIESSEKLSEEIELLKYDKSKVETELTNNTEERNSMNTELNVKNNEIHKLNQHIDSLSSDLANQKSRIHSYEKSLEDYSKLQAHVKEMSDINVNLSSQIEKLNEEIQCSEEKLGRSDLEIKRISELLEKSQASENELRLEMKNMSEAGVCLQNKLKEIECVNESNKSYLVAIEEKDRYINVLKGKIEHLKIAIENNDDSLSKQLESVKFEKEELKCLVDTLKEEATESNAKLTNELTETQELLSQSLIREKRIFDEFKTKLIELQHYNDKITAEQSEIEKYCNDKCLEVEKLTQDLFDNERKIEILENDLTLANRQLGDVNELLNEASKLNTKYEQDLRDYRNKLEELTNENNRLKADLNENVLKNSEIETGRNTLTNDLKNLNSELSALHEKITAKDSELLKLKEELDNKTKLCNDISCKFDEISSNYVVKETELNDKNDIVAKLENELSESKNSIANYEKQLSALNQENIEFKDTMTKKEQNDVETDRRMVEVSQNFNEKINVLESALAARSSELDSCRRTWIGHLTILKGAFFGLKHSYEDLKKSVVDLQNFMTTMSSLSSGNFQEKVETCVKKALQSNKQDLLGEMQHMNQALKQRGEVISKLQNSLSDAEQKLKKANERTEEVERSMAEASSQLEDRDKQIKFKELFIKDLESEISRFREGNDSMTDGDMMSSSTISKAEESSRLKDVEDSFEDKYSKMKLLAMKLKKRVNDLNAALEEEKNKSIAERNDLVEKVQTLTSAAKNAQKLQESFDSVMDTYEEEKKKSKTLESSLQNSLKIQEDLKTEISKLEVESKRIPNMKKHIESLTLNLSNAKKEVAGLQKEKEVEVIKYSELKKEKTKLEEKVSELNASLDQALLQSRNNNLLELEMNNYEKTIEDLSGQLNSEKEKMQNLRSEMESMTSVKSALEEQIKLLENQIKIEEERSSLSNNQLAGVKETLGEVQSLLNEKSEKCDRLERELQEEKQKYESMAVQASTVTSQFTAKEKELETQLGSFQRIVCSLESKVSSRDEEVSRCQAELERVQSEFDAYRTRAQAVLAKQRSETVSQSEREATEQIDKLNHQNSVLASKIDSLMSELEMMKTESLTYTHEKERSDRRIEELNKLLQYKTMEIDKINSDFRSFKISTETLKQCFKTELEEKESSYKTLVENYKHQIEDLTNANKILEAQVEPICTESVPLQSESVMESLPQQREEGEGSESVPSPQIRKRSTNLVPLDVLLNTPYDSESRIGLLCDRISLLEKEVSSYEVRCRHLAGLLSEAERDSARNSQLNSLLKEEIRRLERSLQRQPHAANTEYLKNVIFKFVTLQSGDEKSRLVPVLDTILKLSPEETNKLNAVAKGEVGSGWSNYLPSWPSL